MGKNKLAKFAELETFTNVFQVKSGVLLGGEGFELKGKWNEQYFQNPNPIVLELGCGKGEYTVELARRFPDKNYIGVDIKGARIWSGAKDAFMNEMRNVAFIRTNIEMIFHFFFFFFSQCPTDAFRQAADIGEDQQRAILFDQVLQPVHQRGRRDH